MPYYSARIQKHEDSAYDNEKGSKKGKVYTDMIESIFQNYEGKIIRLNVNFCIPEQ